MAVFNGHAIAGGVFLGLCHDRIIMNESNPKWTVCLNELSFGKAVPHSYVRILRSMTTGRVARIMLLGTKLSCKEALRLDVIQDTYTNDETLQAQVYQFLEQRGVIAKYRPNYRTSKLNMQRELINVLKSAEQYNFETMYDAAKAKAMWEDLLQNQKKAK